MKQMNKVELIEFFIEQLGDNKILGKVMSIEQIRNKLDYIISDVTYKEEKLTYADASWNPETNGKGTLNFNLNRIKTFDDYKKIIIHELLHALSSKIILCKKGITLKGKFEEANVKCGLQISKKVRYYSDGTIEAKQQNVAVNEGMTDILAEMITGIQNNSYSTEKYIYKIVSIIVGEENMLKEYFSEDIQEKKSSLDIFKEDIIEKYGEVLGNDVNEDLKKVLELSDQLLNLKINSYIVSGRHTTNLKFQEEVKDELYDTLENIVCKLIECKKPDIIARADEILMLLTSLNGKISAKILNGLFFRDEIMGSEEKQSMAHSILKKYFEVCKQTNKKDWQTITELYKETGDITLQEWNKKPIIKIILEQDRPETIDEQNDKISQVRYRQIRDYYMILCDDKYHNSTLRADLNEKIFDRNGMALEENKLWSSLDRQIDSEVLKRCSKRIFETKFGISQEQNVADLMERLREKGKELKLKYGSNKQDKDYTAISSVGNLLKIQYSPYSANNDYRYYYEFYSLNSNGELERIELRRRKKFYRRYVRHRYRVTRANKRCISIRNNARS